MAESYPLPIAADVAPGDPGTQVRPISDEQAAREEALVALLEPLGAERERLAELLEPIVIAQAPDTTALRRLCRLCDREACAPCPPWQHLDHPDHLDEYGDSPNSAAGRTAGGPAGGLAGSGG